MAVISIDGGDLVVRIEGLDKLWALKSSLVIPLANVRGATLDPGIIKERKGIRAPGTHVPGVVTAGTFHIDGERVFWDVRDPDKAVVIELADERYARLVVQVDNPAEVVGLIEKACAR
ncbi:hypothetical protein [Nocardia amikacinitolerans]|uniref:hypothetical protein n=1 Tax=Nocardia amikacinitolerans TaxID=756689 RepID=UPI0020A54546|nr:hypothetical protein [Nocardia amikacinitolerans]MCP2279521.1 hypothetical protein [Nocardia amikacinitolerans]MCP2296683.1 hypothetical protein [Nocardia amikacinitolerans]